MLCALCYIKKYIILFVILQYARSFCYIAKIFYSLCYISACTFFVLYCTIYCSLCYISRCMFFMLYFQNLILHVILKNLLFFVLCFKPSLHIYLILIYSFRFITINLFFVLYCNLLRSSCYIYCISVKPITFTCLFYAVFDNFITHFLTSNRLYRH